VTKGASYAYMCLNETVNGIESFTLPDTGDVPLIVDMSSDIMTRPIDVSKFGAIIFGLQKNVGPAGMTVTIVREDLLGRARKYCPSILNWANLAKFESMFNTPCTFAWYMGCLNFRWIKSLGGVEELERRNIKKSEMLYDYIDSSDFYISKIAKKDRSRVNCVFTLKDESLNDEFLKLAKENNLIGLKGHKVLGGMRASIYNAMPVEGVEVLVKFLKEFAAAHK
ncbi:MAG: 3-phosphoserine/phosphohydroxythreonine transaminase, partial [Succinivibrio sp.]